VFTARLDLPGSSASPGEGGFTKGRDRTFHFGLIEKGIVGMISHLGAMLPVAGGLGLAAQLEGTKRVAAAFTGEGATSEGDFHEAVNLAAVWKLPVLFVIENNQYGLSTPRSSSMQPHS
jgi:2-oxoisovalerate dehydrogenase E1 component